MSAPELSVVVLSYERPALLKEALASIEAQRPAADEIIVVDNPGAASAAIDDGVAGFPRVRVVRPATNLGFAGGMNVGIAAAHGTWLLLTEDDIILAPDCLKRLAEHAASHAECGIAAPLMLNQRSGTVRFGGGRIRLGGVFTQDVVAGMAPEQVPLDPQDVDFAPGACLFARRSLLQEVGGFRADFFMYLEDVELCLRVRRLGRKIQLVPAARVAHVEPAPGRVPLRLQLRKSRNLVALYALHAPWRVLPEFVLRYGVWVPLRAGVKGLLRPLVGPLVRRARMARAARRLTLATQGVSDAGALFDAVMASEFAPLQKRSEFTALMARTAALRPRVVVEIGSYAGGTAFLLSRVAAPDATLVLVDDQYSAARQDALRKLGMPGQRIVCLKADSHHAATVERVREAAGGTPIDVLFIDGDHRYDGVAADFGQYSPLVRPGGLIAFHDIVLDSAQREGSATGMGDAGGVPRFWREVMQEHPDAEEIVENPTQDGCGIGVLYWRA